jgi:hypothetical protein
MAALATANNGVLITSGAGVPSISSTLPAAVQGNIIALGAVVTGSYALQTATIIGQTSNNAITAGNLGEQIRSAVARTTISLSNGTVANITSISLTAGVWDVSGIVQFSGSGITGTAYLMSITTTTTGSGTNADSQVQSPTNPTLLADNSLSIPSLRMTFNTTTTVFLTAQAAFTVGSVTAGGRISATRVA